MDLFEYARQKNMDQEAPLASRLRPTTLEEVVGQQHIIGKDKLLYRAIKADKLSSIIFYGPPGTGKTTLGESDCPIRQVQNSPRSMQRWQARKIWKKWYRKRKRRWACIRRRPFFCR